MPLQRARVWEMGFGTLGDHIFARIWKLTSAAVTRTLTRQLDGPWVVSIFTYLTLEVQSELKFPSLNAFRKVIFHRQILV